MGAIIDDHSSDSAKYRVENQCKSKRYRHHLLATISGGEIHRISVFRATTVWHLYIRLRQFSCMVCVCMCFSSFAVLYFIRFVSFFDLETLLDCVSVLCCLEQDTFSRFLNNTHRNWRLSIQFHFLFATFFLVVVVHAILCVAFCRDLVQSAWSIGRSNESNRENNTKIGCVRKRERKCTYIESVKKKTHTKQKRKRKRKIKRKEIHACDAQRVQIIKLDVESRHKANWYSVFILFLFLFFVSSFNPFRFINILWVCGRFFFRCCCCSFSHLASFVLLPVRNSIASKKLFKRKHGY